MLMKEEMLSCEGLSAFGLVMELPLTLNLRKAFNVIPVKACPREIWDGNPRDPQAS